MACVNCQKIRSAILHGKMAEAAGLTVEALRAKFNIANPHEETVEGLRTTIAIDPASDHRAEEAKPTPRKKGR
ncbi:hypothetical protein [Sphingobium sp. UBA5915]|uniref:hypothetical protein n=1 Tax=Sphingobium sp. UBA5915 TaxID=1947530 RepID=UPI0025E259FA|nr:hypothetical protein [Sphingobium sp. UBA5915]